MSLTQDDLSKIGNLIETKLEEKLEEKFVKFESKFDQKVLKLESKFDLKLITLESKLDQKLDQKLAPIKKQIHQIDKKLDEAIQLFDTDVTHLKKRTTRIEDHLGLPTP